MMKLLQEQANGYRIEVQFPFFRESEKERQRKRERERAIVWGYQFGRGKVRLYLKANSYEDVEDSI